MGITRSSMSEAAALTIVVPEEGLDELGGDIGWLLDNADDLDLTPACRRALLELDDAVSELGVRARLAREEAKRLAQEASALTETARRVMADAAERRQQRAALDADA